MGRRIQPQLMPMLWGLDPAEGRERQQNDLINSSEISRSLTTAGLDTNHQADGELGKGRQSLSRKQCHGTHRLRPPAVLWPETALAQQQQQTEQPTRKQGAGKKQIVAQEVYNVLQGELVQSQRRTEQIRGERAGQSVYPRSDGGAQKNPPGVICHELANEALLSLDSTQTVASTMPLLDPGFTFLSHSRPSASKIICLDFDGHTTSGNP